MKILLCILCTFTTIAVVACQRPPEKVSAKSYEITGRVVAMNAERAAITLDHQDIPGLMPAMEMEFPVSSANLLEGVREGDQVQGRLEVRDGDYLITALKKQ